MDQSKSYFCSHCGSSDTKVVDSENKGFEMFVAEEGECSTEYYDSIIMIKCNHCDGTSYPSQS